MVPERRSAERERHLPDIANDWRWPLAEFDRGEFLFCGDVRSPSDILRRGCHAHIANPLMSAML
jgi:hypothetical protein